MILYLDTSAIVKLYVEEEDSTRISQGGVWQKQDGFNRACHADETALGRTIVDRWARQSGHRRPALAMA